jgi:fimbrial isopeptide formation D2 family protein/LPXTG-motif cell wall-anchored protein
MKKLFKRMAAALVATMLVMTMLGGGAISAIAAGASGTTYTVTINPNTQEGSGTVHTYGAYQIFTGDLSGSGSNVTLSNIQWGENIDYAGLMAEIGLSGTAADFADTLTSANIADMAETIAKYLIDPPIAEGSSSISGLPAGYYLIQDIAEPSGTPSAKTKFIIKVLSDEEVDVKSSVPSVEKKVQDKNDSLSGTTVLTNLQDSADYDIGDTVPYTITATIGDGIDNFKAYSLNFIDSMTKGLTLNEDDWAIMAGNQDVTDLFTLSSKAGQSGATVWTWATKNLKSGTTITDGMKVVLTYNCVLNEDAVVGAEGNPNTVQLVFDNNPNSCGNGKPSGTTPKDTNIVFTYKTVFNKVDGSGTPLEGADFKLEKLVDGAWVDVTLLNGANETNPTKDITSGTVFSFTGLDDGKYRLTETQTPAGFNNIDPIEFTITADHEIEADYPELTSLTGTDGAEFTMTLKSLASGELDADIENKAGAVLPSTGGIGTTIFYTLGAILVLGGGVLLVTRKRMHA